MSRCARSIASTKAPTCSSSIRRSASTARCGEPECPIEAILSEDDLTDEQREWLPLNAELSQEWPVITEMKAAPEDAEEWENVEGKVQYLER